MRRPFSGARLRQAGLTIVDQGLSVGGMFLVNVALARTQSKAEYGAFALSYSVFTFFLGLHNAVILETFTIYGSGRYQKHFQSYARPLWRSSLLLGLALTVILASAWWILQYVLPAIASRTVLGMALTCGVLINAAFVRRAFYVRQRPDLAARFSAVFFCCCLLFLWASFKVGLLSWVLGICHPRFVLGCSPVSRLSSSYPASRRQRVLLKLFPFIGPNTGNIPDGFW